MEFLLAALATILPVIAFMATEDWGAADPAIFQSNFDGSEDLSRHFSNLDCESGLVHRQMPIAVLPSGPIYHPIDISSLSAEAREALFSSKEQKKSEFLGMASLPSLDLDVKAANDQHAAAFNAKLDAFLGKDGALHRASLATIKDFNQSYDMYNASDVVLDAVEGSRKAPGMQACAVASKSAVDSYVDAVNQALPAGPKHAHLNTANYTKDAAPAGEVSREGGTLLADAVFTSHYNMVVRGQFGGRTLPEFAILTDTQVSETSVLKDTFVEVFGEDELKRQDI